MSIRKQCGYTAKMKRIADLHPRNTFIATGSSPWTDYSTNLAEAWESVGFQKLNFDIINGKLVASEHHSEESLFIYRWVVLPTFAPVSVHGNSAVIGLCVLVPTVGYVWLKWPWIAPVFVRWNLEVHVVGKIVEWIPKPQYICILQVIHVLVAVSINYSKCFTTSSGARQNQACN